MKTSATQNHSSLKFSSKILNVQFHHLMNVLAYFLFFVVGITLGMILTFYLKDFSFSLRLAQFSFNSTTSNPNMIMPTVVAAPINRPCSDEPHLTGLEKFLKPLKVFHDMNEDELLWRASMAPRISDYPFRRVPKVAFLFLVKGPILLAPLWEKFFQGHQGRYSIYVHSNPSYNGSYPESPVFLGRRIPSQEVEWGNVNMIKAERRLLANALLDISNERFVLLSESCIPLHNFRTVYSYLMNSNKTFVEVYDDPSWVGRGRYHPQMYPQIALSQWRKGSQWFEMNRELAVQVVSDRIYFPVFQNYCKGSCYADEHYLPTFVHMNFASKNSNRTLTWYDFSRGGAHPLKFTRNDVTVELLNNLRNGTRCAGNRRSSDVCHLFARKFTVGTLERLLRFAPKVIHFNS